MGSHGGWSPELAYSDSERWPQDLHGQPGGKGPPGLAYSDSERWPQALHGQPGGLEPRASLLRLRVVAAGLAWAARGVRTQS